MSKPNPATASRRSTHLFWLVALVVIVLAGALFARPYLQSGGPNPGTVLRISMGGWEPKIINAKAGQAVTVSVINLDNSLHSDGGGWHNFVLEGQGVEKRVAPKQTESFNFTLNQPGEYVFYCDICCGGKENPFMRGNVIVEA